MLGLLLSSTSIAAACATGTTGEEVSDDGASAGPGSGGLSGAGGPTAAGPTTDAGSGGATVAAGGATGNNSSSASSSASSSMSSVTASSSNAASSSSSGGCTPVNVLLDGGLEQGPGGPWTQSSSNFGTPLCDVASCGTGGGTGPQAGSWWAWFGGIDFFALYIPEVATLSQTVVINPGTATLELRLEIPACDSSSDTFAVKVDGNPVLSKNGADPLCGLIGYQLQTINLNAYADGNAHTLSFEGSSFANNFGATNFMVDGIQLIACP
jgi:hypothetical protein